MILSAISFDIIIWSDLVWIAKMNLKFVSTRKYYPDKADKSGQIRLSARAEDPVRGADKRTNPYKGLSGVPRGSVRFFR